MTVTGYCNFCGQARIVDIPDETPEYIAGGTKENHYASLECSCKEGSDWRANMLVIERCQDNIEIMFRENYPDIADTFQDAKTLVYSGSIKRITCITPEGGIAAMYKKGGSIEMKYTEKHETTMSADW